MRSGVALPRDVSTIRGLVDRLLSYVGLPFRNGTVVTVTLPAGTPQAVLHGLGRVPKWAVLLTPNGGTFFMSRTGAAAPTSTTCYFISSLAGSFDVWVS